jgi:hypothetical protein
MKLLVHAEEYVIASLPYGAFKPKEGEGFFAVICTTDGTTIVCQKFQEPLTATVEPGWRWVEVPGPFSFSEVGVLRQILEPLSVPIFAVSSFTKDHLFVKETDIQSAIFAWNSSGIEVEMVSGG